MFSNDRLEQLNTTVHFLELMDGFKSCQKTLVVDGKLTVKPPEGFDFIQVPRVDGFCWSDMWGAGVGTAKHDLIWYLDSDRLLPAYYLKLLTNQIRDNAFCFTSRHFMMLEDMKYEECSKFLAVPQQTVSLTTPKVKFEPRFAKVTHSPKKNVMSGNTAFTKKTYYQLGGVDRWYRGHGAFADNDFHMCATTHNCDFVDLEAPELHCLHGKSIGNKLLSQKELDILALNNFIYYCKKWNLPRAYAEDLAKKTKILDYVKTKW